MVTHPALAPFLSIGRRPHSQVMVKLANRRFKPQKLKLPDDFNGLFRLVVDLHDSTASVSYAQEKPVKEVFSSDYLQKQAKKSLLSCLAWAVVAMIASTRRNYQPTIMIVLRTWARIGHGSPPRRGHARSRLCDLPVPKWGRTGTLKPVFLGRTRQRLHRLLRPPPERQRKDLRHRLRPRRSLRALRLRSKASSRHPFLPERNLGTD